jgi:YbbR domain-containing protein
MDKWLQNTNVVRVISLLVSILLWVVVHFENDKQAVVTASNVKEEIYNQVSITQIIDETKYYVSGIEPEKVQIAVKGKESVLNRLKTHPTFQIVLDATSYKQGDHQILLMPQGFPAGVEVEIIPKSVKVNIQPLKSKAFPIELKLIGNPSKEFSIVNSTINVKQAIVKFSNASIDEIAMIQAEVSVDNANNDIKQSVKLNAYDKNGKLVNVVIEPQKVDVSIFIKPAMVSLPVDFKWGGEPLPGYSIESINYYPSKIEVYGWRDTINAMENYIGPELDIRNIKEGKTFTVEIPINDGITKVIPTSIDVEIKVVPSEVRTMKDVPIELEGQKDDFNYKFESSQNSSISLSFEGAPKILNGLSEQELLASVNVSELTLGRHVVEIDVNLPKFIKRFNSQKLTTVVLVSKKE